ncbi:MAG: molybdate ABC transporter substrate-binding protein [Syntrophales bacterium]|jgi:molybdate transport system substrate-binding protein|nr:molybdate ABC transporter substrate-binding protein [Syntrophales bacterium]
MQNKFGFMALMICVLLAAATGLSRATDKPLILCGAAFRMPMDEIVTAFTQQTGLEVNVSYAGVGTLLSQISLSRRGDIFVAPSPDIMKKAAKQGHLVPGTIRETGYFVPSINVQKGNPKRIRSLQDMARPGLRIAIGNPETVYVGILAAEIADKALTPQERKQFRKNIVTYGEDFNKLAALLVLRQVDAVIGFSYLDKWFPEKIDTIKLASTDIQRIGVGNAALLRYTDNRPAAERFLSFLAAPEAERIFRKYHYFATLREACDWIGQEKPVGGDYLLPEDWAGN